MTIEAVEQSIGCYFTVNGRRCQVVNVNRFGAELHFGFMTVDELNPIIAGWIPVELVGQCEFTK